jgi:hypothetical protein
MASIIRIKRSSTALAPSLANGELAYSAGTGTQANGGDRLYFGFGNETNGIAASQYVIGGKYFTDLLDHVHGTVTASSAVIVDSSKKVDEWNVDNITINANTISSTDTNGNIVLTPNGTGYVSVSGTNGLKIPVGTTAQRSPAVQGTVRYNTDTSSFEGYNGAQWGSLGGVKSVDGYTYIIAETTPGASDGVLHFYAENAAGNAAVEVAQLDRTKLNVLPITASTSTTTGALTVGGGVGIAGAVFAGGVLTITDATNAGPTVQTGALVVNNGGAYIMGNMRVGGTLYATLSGSVINNTSIGSTAASTGAFTTLTANDSVTFTKNAGSTSSTSGTLVVTGGVGVSENLYVGNNLVITGNLTVNGTTTTVNSTTVTIDDPVFTLGGDTAPASDDNKDRGIEFKWHNGTAAKLGFFGFDDSTGYFTFIPDATDTGEVYSGTKGTLDVTSITGTAASWTTARTVTFATGDTTGSFSISGSADVANVQLTTQTATTSVKGIASFDSANFTVTSGAVSIAVVDGGTY